MQEHAYDMQAWIYTLALDALLARRIENYDPKQHLGGVYYFFMRGMHLGEQAPLSQQQLSPAPLAETESPQMSLLETEQSTQARSEERRVGKECRSRCVAVSENRISRISIIMR